MENRITVNGVDYVRADSEHLMDAVARSVEGRPYVIVRCTAAGVHSGYLYSREGDEVVLYNSRRLWRWHGRTLSGLAIEGTDNASECKFGDVLPVITLLGACEIIQCSEAARISLESVDKWVND